jgi:hypothetical protein
VPASYALTVIAVSTRASVNDSFARSRVPIFVDEERHR